VAESLTFRLGEPALFFGKQRDATSTCHSERESRNPWMFPLINESLYFGDAFQKPYIYPWGGSTWELKYPTFIIRAVCDKDAKFSGISIRASD
jgi:hypothetical protein